MQSAQQSYISTEFQQTFAKVLCTIVAHDELNVYYYHLPFVIKAAGLSHVSMSISSLKLSVRTELLIIWAKDFNDD